MAYGMHSYESGVNLPCLHANVKFLLNTEQITFDPHVHERQFYPDTQLTI